MSTFANRRSNHGVQATGRPTPGQAQSQQSPYANSTQYGQANFGMGQGQAQSQPGPQVGSFLGGPQRDPRWSHNGGSWHSGREPAPQQGGFQAYAPQQQGASSGQQQGGYQAYGQQQGGFQQQMPTFQFTGGTDWMGNQYTDPNAMMAQQGAMAYALNQQRGQQISQGNFGPLNPQLAYGQGASFLQQGFTNPFAQQQPARQDSAAAIRNLLQGYGVPDNVMSQLTGMFGGQQGSRPGPNGEPPGSGYWLSTADTGGPGGGPSNTSWINSPVPSQTLGRPDLIPGGFSAEERQFLLDRGMSWDEIREAEQLNATSKRQEAGRASPEYAEWRAKQPMPAERKDPNWGAQMPDFGAIERREQELYARFERERSLGSQQPNQQQTAQPGYGTPPEHRGNARTLVFLDRDRDGVDDRDQDGPGMPAYGRPGQGGPFMPSDRRGEVRADRDRIKRPDPRREMESLQRTQVADAPYWQGRSDAPGGSVWDHPDNWAVRERVLADIAAYDRDPYEDVIRIAGSPSIPAFRNELVANLAFVPAGSWRRLLPQPVQDPRATSTPYGGYADPYLNFVSQTMPQHLDRVLAERRRNGIGDDGKHTFRPTVDRSAANATSLANVKALAQLWKTT